jgi:2'-5' RNA ligase
MRLFVGVPLLGAARQRAAAVLANVQPLGWPVRWVRAEGLHLTLKFFGEVTTDRLAAIAELVTFATDGLPPMVQRLGGLGVFPAGSRPRVIHMEVEAGIELELLQDRLERGGERLGFAPEGRAFRPHVTLGRVREGHRLPEGWEAVLGVGADGTAFVADQVVLYESQLGPAGPVYEARHAVQLT